MIQISERQALRIIKLLGDAEDSIVYQSDTLKALNKIRTAHKIFTNDKGIYKQITRALTTQDRRSYKD